MTCPYQNPSPRALDIGKYFRLHQDGKRLIDSWFTRAFEARMCLPTESFEPFIFCWISFNAWASCVTGVDTDREIVRRIYNCPELRSRFDNLRTNDPEFSNAIAAFSGLWPIFKAQQLRRQDIHYQQGETRQQTIERYFRIPNISFEPECWREHENGIPLDLPHSLAAIYRVRCNLFHGEKSPHSEMDAIIVKAAFDVLVRFLSQGQLIVPNNN